MVFKSIDWWPFFLGVEFGTTAGDAIASLHQIVGQESRMFKLNLVIHDVFEEFYTPCISRKDPINVPDLDFV